MLLITTMMIRAVQRSRPVYYQQLRLAKLPASVASCSLTTFSLCPQAAILPPPGIVAVSAAQQHHTTNFISKQLRLVPFE